MRGLLRKLLFVALALVVLGALAYRSRRIINLQDFSWDRLVLAVRHARGSLLLVSLLAGPIGPGRRGRAAWPSRCSRDYWQPSCFWCTSACTAPLLWSGAWRAGAQARAGSAALPRHSPASARACRRFRLYRTCSRPLAIRPRIGSLSR